MFGAFVNKYDIVEYNDYNDDNDNNSNDYKNVNGEDDYYVGGGFGYQDYHKDDESQLIDNYDIFS